MGRGTLEDVREWSGDRRGGLKLVGVPKEGTGQIGDPRGSPRRVEGPSGRSGPGRGTIGEVRNGSRDPQGSTERVTRP